MPDSKIGKEMAQRVADRMKMKCDLMFSHRDYCGTGLTWMDHTFIYGHVYDGYMQQPIKEFKKEQEFVNWLAEQSDHTLDGHDETDQFYHGNQRLNQGRLFGFVSSKPIPRSEFWYEVGSKYWESSIARLSPLFLLYPHNSLHV